MSYGEPIRQDSDVLPSRVGAKLNWQSHSYGDNFPTRWQLTDDRELTGNTSEIEDRMPWESQLTYQRHLLNGETFRYEFWYAPNEFVVHPVISDAVVLLNPDGARLHAVVPFAYNGMGGSEMPRDNEFDVPEYLRGSGKPSFKADAWNMAELTRTENRVTLKVNGEEIYEYPLDGNSPCTFGFFRDRRTEKVRIRNAFLTGNWPKELPEDIQQKVFSYDDSVTPEQQQVRRKLFKDYAAEVTSKK